MKKEVMLREILPKNVSMTPEGNLADKLSIKQLIPSNLIIQVH